MCNFLNDRIAKNHEKLKSIIDCVIVLGKQNIAFRGHNKPVVKPSLFFETYLKWPTTAFIFTLFDST